MAAWSVVLNIVQPATAAAGSCAFLALEEAEQYALPYGASRPYYFVSHAWSRPLRETVSMLTHHFRGRDLKEVYVWVDILAVPQHTWTAVEPEKPDMELVNAALQGSSGVLLCVDELGVSLRRTWCLYEAWMGATTPAAVGPAAGEGSGSGAGAAGCGPSGNMAPGPGEGGQPLGVLALTPRALLPEERARLFSKVDMRSSRSKHRSDRDALLAAARAGAGAAGLDGVNHTLRVLLTLQSMVPDVSPELHPGRVASVRELWDMGPVDGWLELREADRNYQALALFGPACSGKTVAAAAVAQHLRAAGVPVAAHFCSVSDVRTLDPIALVVSLALQLARDPRVGLRLLRQYGELPPEVLAELLSHNTCGGGVEAAVEALLVQPLQRLAMEQADEELDGDGGDDAAAEAAAAKLSAKGAAAAGRGWHYNGDLSHVGGADDDDEEDEEEGGGAGGPGGRSVRAPSAGFVMPQAVVLLIDGLDQADGTIVGGAAGHDNPIVQLVEEHLPRLPGFVRLVLTSRSLQYIRPRIADKLSPLELAPEQLRPTGPFMRNLRLAFASIHPAMPRRARAASAASLAARARGQLLHVRMALAVMALEQQAELEEAEEQLAVAAAGGAGPGVMADSAADMVRRPSGMVRSGNSKVGKSQFNLSSLPQTLNGLLERYLAFRLRRLSGPELRNKAATLLAVLAAAREPITLTMAAMALRESNGAFSLALGSQGGGPGAPGGGKGGGGGGTESGPGPGGMGPERLLWVLVHQGLGALVRLRGRPGHYGQEVVIAHSAIAEWLQVRPRVLLGGQVVVDVAAGHRALAALCRDDALSCLDRGRLPPTPYAVRHVFLHVGLAALAAAAEEDAHCGYSPTSTARSSTTNTHTNWRRRSSTNSASNASVVALASALAAAAAAADWISTLELLLQRLDLWTSIYTAGAGSCVRWVVTALAALPMCHVPSPDPGVADSALAMLLAETRRWLLLHHPLLCWYPNAVVPSAATLPQDSILRGRAVEYSAGPDPSDSHGGFMASSGGGLMHLGDPRPSNSSAGTAHTARTGMQQQHLPGGNPVLATAATAAAQNGAEGFTTQVANFLLLNTGDRWSSCVQTLRTNLGRVRHVALQPQGRMLATVHDGGAGIVLWDLWGGRQLGVMAGSGAMGRNPTAAHFTPDGRRLVCAADAVYVWEVSTCRLLLELCKAAPRAKGASSARRANVPTPANGAAGGGGGGEEAAAAAVSGGVSDPDGPVTALALSPGGSRAAAGHANGATRVWDIHSGKLLCAMSVSHRRPVTALGFSLPAGATLVAAHGEGGGRAKAGAPVGEHELQDVPTAYIKADDLTLHVWRVQGGPAKELEVLKGHTGRVNAVTFSTRDGNLITGSSDETVRTWWDDPKTPQSDYRQLFILGGAGQGAVHAVQFSAAPPPRRRRAAAATTSRPAATDAGHFDSSGAAGPEITAASFASLAAAAVGRPVGAGGGEVETASTRESTPAGRPSAPGVAAPPPRGGSGPDGDGEEVDENEEDRRHAEEELPLMAYACGSGVVRLWSPVAQRQLGLLRGMEGPVGSVSFSEDGRLLATADQSDSGTVRVWDVGGVSTRDPVDSSPASGAGGMALKHPVEAMALSPDGRRLALVCADPTKESVRVVDVLSGKRLATMGAGGAGGHAGRINAVGWSWDSSRLATGSDDLSVRVWYVGKPTAPPGNALAKAAVIVAAEMAQMDQQQQQQRSSSGALLQKVASGVEQGSPRGSCQGVQRSRSGGSGGSGGGGGEDGGGEAPARPGSCLLVLEGHHRKVQCVAWAHDGGRLASGGYDNMVRIWDTTTGEQLQLIYQVSWVSALAFCPDDSRLATGAGGGSLFMFNSTTGKQLAGHTGTEGSEDWVVALRFNPDGTLLSSRDVRHGVALWDVSGMRLRRLRALEGAFREAQFDPTSGDLLLFDLTGGALVTHAIPCRSLPLGRVVQRAVALSHPLLEFRGAAAEAALGHNAAVLLSGDGRAFFFVTGGHLAEWRREQAGEGRAAWLAGGLGGVGELGWDLGGEAARRRGRASTTASGAVEGV